MPPDSAMRQGQRITVIIPALNEAAPIARVLADVPGWVDHIIVADNGSSDNTADIARQCGAAVAVEPSPGYGGACLAGMKLVATQNPPPDIIVFLDADYSDHPDRMDRLVDPIIAGDAAMVIGSRRLGRRQPGAMTPQQRFGNRLACTLIRLFWGRKHTDLGPFRAVRYDALLALDMDDTDWGWTVQMQVRAAKRGVSAVEVPVDYRKRIGKSKISGTVKGVIAAGWKILTVIFREAMGWGSRKASKQESKNTGH